MRPNTLTLREHSEVEERLEPRDQLFVVLQSDRPLDGASRHLLDGVDRVTIGRGDARKVERVKEGKERVLDLRFPDARMSSTHARIVRAGGAYVLEDAGSKNGSRVDGAAVTRQALRDGSILELGLTTLVVRLGLPSEPDGETDPWIRPPTTSFSTLLPEVTRALDELSRIARSMLPILLLGETGTGKEVTARAVHALSGRAGAFIAVNCAALPDTLVEATLFGHKRGAYSGAVADNPGLAREAEGGSLLLDEVGDLPLPAQGALLRMLQEGEILPVGASRPVQVDVRVLAATHRPMAQLVAQGKVREDLYARLAGFVVTLPPLRERREDIGLILSSFLQRKEHPLVLGPGTMASLLRCEWPRNIRELEKWTARADALSKDGVLRHDSPEDAGRPSTPDDRRGPPASKRPTDDAELRREVEAALQQHQGNIAAVAAAFRTSRSQVHRWLKRFGLTARGFRE